MSGGRLILTYLGAMAVFVVLAMWPLTGFVAMVAFVLVPWAAFLIGLMFNAMLLHVAYAGLRGRIARQWLLLPALVYGGFALFSAAGYWRARSLRHDLESAAAVDLARVPAAHPALLLVPAEPALDRSKDLAFALAGIGTDAEVHTVDERWQRKPRGGRVCPPAPGESPYTERIAGACVVDEAAQPPAGAVRVRVTVPRPFGDDALSLGPLVLHSDGVRLAAPRLELRYDVSAQGQAIGHAASGRIVHPFPVPMPYLACFMSDAAGWHCDAGLLVLTMPYGERAGAGAYARKAAYLVTVLGLKRTPP